MHLIAKRSIEIAWHPSVRLSVMLVDQDHIGWKSWKLIAWTISKTPSLEAQKAIHLLPGEHGEIWGKLEVGWKKSGVLEHKSGNISETREDGKVTMEDQYIGSHQLSFERYHPRPLRPPLPQDWGSQPNLKLQSILSQERLKLRTANLADTFTGSIRTKAHEKFRR